MKTKFLLINLSMPECTKYRTPKQCAVTLWGAKLDNFVIMAYPEKKIIDLSLANGDVKEIENILNAYLAKNQKQYILLKECEILCKEGKPISAIKHHREVTGSSLREAKEYIDKLRIKLGIDTSSGYFSIRP